MALFDFYNLLATLDASKEDGWFDALRHLIFHLQERRVWMPEFAPIQPISDILLFPMQNCNLEFSEGGDSLKVCCIYQCSFKNKKNLQDYGIYDATLEGASSAQSTPLHR